MSFWLQQEVTREIKGFNSTCDITNFIFLAAELLSQIKTSGTLVQNWIKVVLLGLSEKLVKALLNL